MTQQHRRRPARRFRSSRLGTLLWATLAACGATLACADDKPVTSEQLPPGAGPDRPDNGEIHVDEASILGAVDGTKLRLRIPARSISSQQAKGSLHVSVLSLDGADTRSSADVAYDIAPTETVELTVDLDVPSGVSEQPAWVDHNLRVDDRTAEGLRITRSLLYVVDPYDIRLEGPAKLSADKQVTYRVRAQHPLSGRPLPGVPVTLHFGAPGQTPTALDETTNDTGDAVFSVTTDAAGTLEVGAETERQGTTAAVSSDVQVSEPGGKVLLTTDKPLYQPGQTMHLRALALDKPGNTPRAGAAVLFEVEDGKGNKVLKHEGTSDGYGIAATTFTVGRVVNMGTYKLRVTVDGNVTEKTVQVARYALPKFGVDVEVDRPWYAPGDAVVGFVDSQYFFGQTVAGGDVKIEGYTVDVGETPFGEIIGKTDATGRMAFSVALPSFLAGLPLEEGRGLAFLRVTVTDTAGQVVQKEIALTVAQSALAVAVVPEATRVVPGVENRLLVYVTDPLGAPVSGAAVALDVGGETLAVTTDAFGHAAPAWTPGASDASTYELAVTVTPTQGAPVATSISLGGQEGGEHVLVRTDKSVYEIGDTVNVEIVSTGSSRAYVDWLNEGQAVDMRTVELTGGTGTFSMPIDTSLLGGNRVEAYVVDDDGNLVRAGRTLFAKSDASLTVSLATDKTTYAPGEPAALTFSVVDETGAPAVAALGVQIVDEAVFALVDARPGLLKTYFELEDDFSAPQYEIHGPVANLTDLIFNKTASADAAEAEAAQATAAGAMAAIGGQMTGIQLGSWKAVVFDARQRVQPALESTKGEIAEAIEPQVTAAVEELAAAGCMATDYWCDPEQLEYGAALKERVAGGAPFYDFWGNAFATEPGDWDELTRLRTRGPDERDGTDDDATVSIKFSDLNVDVWQGGGFMNGGGTPPFANPGDFGAGGAGGGGAATGGASSGGTGAADGESGPRVRRDFPETLYVNPAIITGGDGTATVSVDMADSITEWRVSSLASTLGGKLGGGTAGVTVFQDFFVDIDFPATLTRGDEVEFPIAVYNYLTTAQSVDLTLEAAGWYTPLGATSQTVDLAPGEVVGVRFPVRVEQVGVQSLTVTGLGSTRSDAVQRVVRVVPDGKAFPETFSGSLGPGSVTHSPAFPANAVPGSPDLFLNVYPAFLSQVVQGMDSMLQVPSGCFEQTTSTTWPNVLVTDYMEATGQTTTEIQLKADSLISAGYQRLLTFEHPGGGFSWFGTQDPAPFLSVTAFGLMEFADMSQVADVDQAMVARTQDWMLSQQKADGSWEGDQSEFFSFHTSAVRNTAFVVWALASGGYQGSGLASAVGFITGQLDVAAEDAYTLGLVANALALAAPSEPTLRTLFDRLEATKQTSGDHVFWDSGGTQTNFYGGGDDAAISATALVAHAMLLDGGHKASVDGALAYLTSQKDSLGNFGSTQATVWTLRTLLLAATKGTEGAVGSFDVSVDGAPFTTVDLTADQGDVMTTVDLSTLATSGTHDVALTFAGTGKVSYNLVATHHLAWADVPPEATGALSVDVSYDKALLRLAETVTATLSVANNTASTQNMVILTAGIPPGFSVVTEDLAAYQQAGALKEFELTGKQLTLYLAELPPNATAAFDYRLTATMPVRVDTGGAEAWLYYQPEQRVASASTQLEATE